MSTYAKSTEVFTVIFRNFARENSSNKKNIRYSLHRNQHRNQHKDALLGLSTIIHVVRKQIKFILLNERPCDISLARLRDLICRVYQCVNDVSVCCYIFQRRKSPLGFSNSLDDKSIDFSVSHPSLVSRTCLAKHFITDTK